MPPHKKLKIADAGSEEAKKSQSKTESDLGVEWREKCAGIRAINSYALRKNILSDVTFLVGKESAVYHAHRLFLALGSPVFEAMFYGPLAEKSDTITIPDVDPEGFQNLLKFLYSDDAQFENVLAAFKTAYAADKYCVTLLKEKCEYYLQHCSLSSSNVWMYIENSLCLTSQIIRDRSFNFLMYNTESAVKHSSFLDVSPKTIETLLSFDSLNMSEMNLLQYVIHWAEHKSRTRGADLFQDIMKPLLKYMRFGDLKATEFACLLEVKKLKDLLDDHNALAILKHTIEPESYALPDWCCSKPRHLISCQSSKDKIVLKGSKNKISIRCHLISKSRSNRACNTSSSSSSSSSSTSSSCTSSSSSSSDSNSSDSDISL